MNEELKKAIEIVEITSKKFVPSQHQYAFDLVLEACRKTECALSLATTCMDKIKAERDSTIDAYNRVSVSYVNAEDCKRGLRAVITRLQDELAVSNEFTKNAEEAEIENEEAFMLAMKEKEIVEQALNRVKGITVGKIQEAIIINETRACELGYICDKKLSQAIHTRIMEVINGQKTGD